MKRLMRRAASLLLALVLAAGMVPAAGAAGTDGQGGSIGGVYETRYGESGKGDTLLKTYNENDPSSYSDSVQWTFDDGVVTISGRGATADFGLTNSPFAQRGDIEAVVVEEGVTSLGTSIFSEMPNLRAVILMDASTTLRFAFNGEFPSLEAVLVGADLEEGTYNSPVLPRAEEVLPKILPLTRNVILGDGNSILADDSDLYISRGDTDVLVMDDGERVYPDIKGIEFDYWSLVENANVRFLPFEDILAMARGVVQDLPEGAKAGLPAELTSGSTAVIPDPEDPDQTEDPVQNTDPAAPEDPEDITETTQPVVNGLTHLRTSYSENDSLDLSIRGSTLTVSGRILADGLRQVQVRCGSGRTVDAASGEYFSVQLDLSFSGRRSVDVYTNRGGGSTFSSYIYNRIVIQNTGSGYQIMPSLVMEHNEQYNESYVNPQRLLDRAEVPASVAAMSDQIVGDERDPYTQVFLLHQWVSENIAYDYIMFGGAPWVTDSAGVLEIRRSVCAGYASLLRDLILAQGIPAMDCTNDALYSSYALTTAGGAGHAHVEAYVNGRWVVMDPTWDSRNKYYGPDNQEWESPNGYYYFDITPEAFALDHKITTRGGTWNLVSDGGFILDPEDSTRLIGYVGPAGRVVVPDGIVTIGERAFSPSNTWTPAPDGITEIVLPDSVTTIEGLAFYQCADLTSVTLPEGLRTLGNLAFGQCTALRSIQLPGTLTTIEGQVFSHSGLASVILPDSVASVGDSAFAFCADLREFTIPAGVQLGVAVLSNCGGLRRVVIEAGRTEIPLSTFYRCSALSEITIPASVTSVGNAAFFGCAGLENVYYGGSQQQWSAIRLGQRNDPLRSAEIHFGSFLPVETPVTSAWAESFVLQSEELGLIPGGVLGSDYTHNITRAQFAALAVQTYETIAGRSVPLDLGAGDALFADSRGDTFVAKAYNLGILSGYNSADHRSGVEVGPDDPITREQAATMLARLNEVLGRSLTPAGRLPFGDAISGWAYDSVSRVYQAGIMTGTGADTFGASESYTIEQAITTMYQTYQF